MNKTVVWIIGGVVGLGLIVLLALSIASEPDLDEAAGFGEVTVDGTPLPFLADTSTSDPALGMIAPTVTGTDWEENETTVEADGRPKVLVFLAHWCPHCQNDVPVIQEWIDGGGAPDDVDIYSFTVYTNKLRPNWPPQDWLVEEGWTPPVIMDDAAGSVVSAYGVQGTPFYVVLDGDNVNLGRFSGEVGVFGMEAMVDLAQASLGGS